MDTRKASAPWYIAATHYLTAGFVIPFIGGFLFGILFAIAGVPLGTGPLNGLFMAPVSLMLVFFGVMYSARFVQKRYIIADFMEIVNLSTIYLVVLRVLFMGIGIAFLLSPAATGTPEAQALPVIVGFGIVQTILEAAVFYFSSKKFLGESPDLGLSMGVQPPAPQPPVQPQS